MVWRKIISLFLIPILLWAGMGFMLSRHYCFDELVSEHLYHSENSCGMDILAGKEACHEEENDETSFKERNCCRNEWIQIDNIDTVNHEPQQEVTAGWQPVSNVILGKSTLITLQDDSLSGSNSSPPERIEFIKTKDFLTNTQCYLI